MSNNRNLVPEAKEALNRFKMEAAAEVGVNLKQGYNGNLTSKEAGSIGGQMVKKMVESYENSIKGNNWFQVNDIRILSDFGEDALIGPAWKNTYFFKHYCKITKSIVQYPHKEK